MTLKSRLSRPAKSFTGKVPKISDLLERSSWHSLSRFSIRPSIDRDH